MLIKKIGSRAEYLKELKTILRSDNYFTLMEMDLSRGFISYDTEFTGFEGALEKRVLSYRLINDVRTLVEFDYNIFVIDFVSLAIWVKKGGKAIVHRTVVESVFSDFLKPRAARKSLTRGMVKADLKTSVRRPSRRLRERLRRDSGYRCVLCGSEADLSIHHLLPFRHGGITELDNLILFCEKCHDIIEKEGPLKTLTGDLLESVQEKPFGIFLWTMWPEDLLLKLKEKDESDGANPYR